MSSISSTWANALILICWPSPPITAVTEAVSRATGLRVSWAEELYGPISSNALQDVEILVTLRALPQSRAECPRLRYCHLLTAGWDYVASSPLFHDSSITWTSSSGIHGPSIAEWVFMMYTVFEGQFERYRHAQQRRQWLGEDFRGMTHRRRLHGQRLGILGYGSIGRCVARVGQAFGMELVVITETSREVSNTRRPVERDGTRADAAAPEDDNDNNISPSMWFSMANSENPSQDGGKQALDKTELHRFLAQRLDLLVICVPLCDRTRHLLGAEEFQILRRHSPRGGVFLCNVARGDVVAQDDLVWALNHCDSGVRGAALDVQSPEPLPADHALWAAENCFLTPHVSGQDDTYLERGVQIMLHNLSRATDERWINKVNRTFARA